MMNLNSISFPPYVFSTHVEAENATKLLSRNGFDIKKLSIVGKGYHCEVHPLGFYTASDKIKLWGTTGSFWGGLWGLLFLPAVFYLPGFGLVATAGPFVDVLISTLEGALVVGGLSALGAALTQIGVPEGQVLKYETDIKAEKFLLIVHGSHEEHEKVRVVLGPSAITKESFNR
jgi:hypothetical protein